MIQALTERQHELFRLRKVFYGGFGTQLFHLFLRSNFSGAGPLFAVSLMQTLICASQQSSVSA